MFPAIVVTTGAKLTKEQRSRLNAYTEPRTGILPAAGLQSVDDGLLLRGLVSRLSFPRALAWALKVRCGPIVKLLRNPDSIRRASWLLSVARKRKELRKGSETFAEWVINNDHMTSRYLWQEYAYRFSDFGDPLRLTDRGGAFAFLGEVSVERGEAELKRLHEYLKFRELTEDEQMAYNAWRILHPLFKFNFSYNYIVQSPEVALYMASNRITEQSELTVNWWEMSWECVQFAKGFSTMGVFPHFNSEDYEVNGDDDLPLP